MFEEITTSEVEKKFNSTPLEAGIAITHHKELIQLKLALDRTAIIVITDLQGKINYVNENFCEISKYSEEQLLGQNHRIINSGYHPRSFFQNMWVTISKGEVWHGEICNRAQDGTLYWVDTSIIPFLDENNRPYQYLAIRHDITSRKQTEEQFKSVIVLQKGILDSADYSIISTDINGKIKSFNRGAEKLLGYQAEEMIGKTPEVFHDVNEVITNAEILSTELGKKIEPGFEVFVAKARTGIVSEGEWTYIRKDGSRFPVRLSVTSLTDNDGNLTGFLGIGKDISDRIRYQKEIDRFFTISLDLLCIANTEGYFIRLNPVWEDVLGYTTKELMSKPYIEFIHPDDIEPTIAEAQKLAAGIKVIKFENRYRCKDGSYRWLEWSAAPFVEEGTLYATARDLTERKQAEMALKAEISQRRKIEKHLREQTIKLEQSNRELQDFAYVASHDLQEPLRKIQTFGDRLKAKFSDVLTDKGLDYLERMQNASKRSQILINDLLSFSRVTTQAQPFVSISLMDVIAGVLSDMEIRIEEVNAQIEITDLPNIEADPLQMQQLFQNLLSNALKFRRDQVTPTIQIQNQYIEAPIPYAQDQDHVSQWCQITVADNGIGFEEKYLDRIFQVFQRLHNRSVYTGTGVGLAICRKIVERHHGNITATSSLGDGSTFMITLPIKQITEGENI